MKVSYLAAGHVNSILEKTSHAADAFTNTPELFRPEFWEFIFVRAENRKYAQTILEELDDLASQGVTVSTFVSQNIVKAMKITTQHSEMRNLRSIVSAVLSEYPGHARQPFLPIHGFPHPSIPSQLLHLTREAIVA
ncbi:hypothetical protein ACO0LB_19835 [Undibacterium sp. SXout7W]|uniref:hypothetical protein n=1 Tax=Undibacterium sp. SXout7W TaxID=3413049 RepID=UPI003BF14D1E